MELPNCATKLTREIWEGKKNPSINMWNGKPFRTKRNKALAREHATKRADGAWRVSLADAPVSYHPTPRGQ